MADRAKLHPLLKTLREELHKKFITDTFEVFGHKYTMRTLNEDDEVWSDQFVKTLAPMSLMTGRRIPHLAASITQIDGIHVNTLFEYPDDMPDSEKKRLNDSAENKKYWLYSQMMIFLLEDANREVVTALYEKFAGLRDRTEAAAKEIPKS